MGDRGTSGRREGREGVSVGGTKEWRERSCYRGTWWGIGGQVGGGEGREGVSVAQRNGGGRKVGIGEQSGG